MSRSRATREDMRSTDNKQSDGMMPRISKAIGGVVPDEPEMEAYQEPSPQLNSGIAFRRRGY